MKLDQISAAATGVYGTVKCNWDDDENRYRVRKLAFQLSGTFSGSLAGEVSFNGTDFVPVAITNLLTNGVSANVTTAGSYVLNTEGAVSARFSVTRTTGTLVITPVTVTID